MSPYIKNSNTWDTTEAPHHFSEFQSITLILDCKVLALIQNLRQRRAWQISVCRKTVLLPCLSRLCRWRCVRLCFVFRPAQKSLAERLSFENTDHFVVCDAAVFGGFAEILTNVQEYWMVLFACRHSVSYHVTFLYEFTLYNQSVTAKFCIRYSRL